jgi:hypothetical protein
MPVLTIQRRVDCLDDRQAGGAELAITHRDFSFSL